MPSFLSTFLTSPLAREPHLAWRKVAARLGSRPEPGPSVAPVGIAMSMPVEWAPQLRAWFAACEVREAPPAEAVFGAVWPRDLLLEICRQGPRQAKDLTGDIKLGWDFARSHHMPLHALLRTAGCAQRFAAEITELMSCPPKSPFWSCPMDVAIRAVNWLAADALLDGGLGRAVGPSWAGILWQHLDVIWRHLEAFRISSNHYLSNLLGLTALGRVLPGDPLARRALAFARREWPRALLAQTYEDGGVYEASIPYHAFVVEMALVTRMFDATAWPAPAEQRLRASVGVIAAHRTGGGGLPAIGDDDSGRVLAVDHAGPTGRADALLKLATQLGVAPYVPADGCFPASGWWTRREGPWFVHLEFGGVGCQGEGAHAHDDDLSLYVEHDGHPVFADPGSHLYTPDRESRDEFRSSRVHTTVRLLREGAELPRLEPGLCFIWRGRNAPLACSAVPAGLEVCLEMPPGRITRRVEVHRDAVVVTDRVEAASVADACWQFHVHPQVEISQQGDGYALRTPGDRVILTSRGDRPVAGLHTGCFSPQYGSRGRSSILRASVGGVRSACVIWSLTA